MCREFIPKFSARAIKLLLIQSNSSGNVLILFCVCICVRVHVYMRACVCSELSALLRKPGQIAPSLLHSRPPEASFQHEIYFTSLLC